MRADSTAALLTSMLTLVAVTAASPMLLCGLCLTGLFM